MKYMIEEKQIFQQINFQIKMKKKEKILIIIIIIIIIM